MKLQKGDIFWDGINLRIIYSVNYEYEIVYYHFKPNSEQLTGRWSGHQSGINFFNSDSFDNAGRKISKKVALKILKLKGE